MATTQTTSPYGTPAPGPQHDVAVDNPRRTSPVLLGALAVALIAMGAWWYTQRSDVSAPDATTAPMASSPVIQDSTPAPGLDTAAPAATPRADRARPAVADRSPRPLAGNPIPSYPRSALRSGSEGSVVVSIAVGADGVPTDVQVVERSGNRELDRAAMQAARDWRFEPAIRNGKAVAASVRLPVDFRRG